MCKCRIGESVIVRIVNSPAKYSIEELPGDTWEIRRTKQIIRAILRAKNEVNATTEALAKSCSAYLGEPDAVKVSTLNGLFAGKRKTISVIETQMFADVLFTPLSSLLYPEGEAVEIRPGHHVKSSDALAESLVPEVLKGFRNGGRTEAVLNVIRGVDTLEAATRRFIWADRTEQRTADAYLREVKFTASVLRMALDKLNGYDKLGMDLPETCEWVLTIPHEDMITPAFLLGLEPLFDGFVIDGYRMEAIHVEHQEEA